MNVSGLTYTFESCPPEDVIYQLDYNKEGLDHKDEYIQMFQDCGWEYVQIMVAIAISVSLFQKELMKVYSVIMNLV